MPIAAGTHFGPYEVTGPIGSGGMGEVYRARDENLKREVAIKVLPSSLAADAERLARFQREAEVLASLNHANIAQIYGLERVDGTTALAMELVEGPTLAERIAQGRLPVDEALRVATQTADALEAAHEHGIVHRDPKPANIKVRPDGTVKVLDFGIAKALDTRTTGPGPAALTTPAMTEAGIVLGTAAYMSPEQARGLRVDERTDIWAFACVLYEMLTGQAAFLGEDVTTTLARVLQTNADWSALPSRVPASVRRTLELCLEKDPQRRVRHIADVRLGLAGAFATGEPVLRQPFWRRALPAAATLALGALLVAAYFMSQRPLPPSIESAAPLPVSRLSFTPPATAPLANEGDLDLTISPDGRRIAYWARRPDNGNLELYVRELDALDARAVPGTEHAVAGPRNLFFSPDGRSIGYGAQDGSVVVVAIDGRPPVRLVENVRPFFLGASWSADDTLVFSSLVRLERLSAGSRATPEPLMAARQGGGVAGPVLLPGGQAVLFHAFSDNAGDRVAVLDLATEVEKTVIDGGSNPAYLDTGHVLFARGDTLMAAPFSASELTVTGDAVPLVRGVRRDVSGATDYALSANGTLVYVSATPTSMSEVEVVWVDRAGQVVGQAVPERVMNPRDPRLSPDAQRLLLVTGDETEGGLWSYDLRGRPPIPLALANAPGFPVWSPDGRQVVFLVDRVAAVVTLAADGSERAPRLVREGGLGPMAWSEAGELILWDRAGDIVAAPASSTAELRSIVASDSTEADPALSPDGRWLAYVSNRTGQNEVWVQGYPEGVPVRVSSDGGYEPLWSPDGRELFYRRNDAVMAVSVEAGTEFSFAAARTLFSGPYISRLLPTTRSYDVASDGRFLMLLRGEGDTTAPASIVVVQNFGEELKQRVRPRGQ